MEPNLLGQATLDQEVGYTLQTCASVTGVKLIGPVKVPTIDEVTVELETGIVEDEVNPPSALGLEPFHSLPQFREAVVEDVLFCPCKLFTTGSLQGLDLLLGHVDEQ